MCKLNVVQVSAAFSSLMMNTSTRSQLPFFRSLSLIFVLCFVVLAQQVPVTPAEAPSLPQESPQKPVQPAVTPGSDQKPASQVAGPAAPVDSNSYKVGPADVLNVRVWDEPQFSGPVSVQENGKITLPLVGDVQAGGQTPVEIELALTKALTKYIVKPLVTVTVQEVGSRRYYMDGQINRPGEYPLVVPTTVLEAMSKAGGTQEFANRKKIYILRGDKRIPFNYKDVLRGNHMDENILLQPGDHVVVP